MKFSNFFGKNLFVLFWLLAIHKLRHLGSKSDAAVIKKSRRGEIVALLIFKIQSRSVLASSKNVLSRAVEHAVGARYKVLDIRIFISHVARIQKH